MGELEYEPEIRTGMAIRVFVTSWIPATLAAAPICRVSMRLQRILLQLFVSRRSSQKNLDLDTTRNKIENYQLKARHGAHAKYTEMVEE